jgi:N-acetylmuramoyl-L-alanine amidase
VPNVAVFTPEPIAAPATATVPEEAITPPAFSPAPDQWISWDQWSELNGWGKAHKRVSAPVPSFELKSTNGNLSITIGSRVATWNGLSVCLGFVPQLLNGMPCVHGLDVIKTFEPLMRRMQNPGRGRVIVLDPGHGGDNHGARSVVGNVLEKSLVLDWAFRTQKLLSDLGWQVYMTRTNDITMSLEERVAFADRVKAGLFISLHFNSVPAGKAAPDHGGIETYCLTPAGMPSTITRNFEDDLRRSFPNNDHDPDNLLFAVRLHRALVATTGRRDRGVRRARFMTVLQGQNRPAVLLEGGYLSDPIEARLINTAQYRQHLAEAVARALSE